MSADTRATLIRMANQIARAFEPEGRERAVPKTAEHVLRYWDPRMKRAMADHIAAGAEGLDPVALEALRGLGGKSQPSDEAIKPLGHPADGGQTPAA